jgi:large subunit ribosomal protein L15
MKLNQLENKNRKNRKRVGRGIGSGTGKTCGSGHKGQKSRTGVSINGFEGGQTPIYRRIPKRGFVNPFKITFQTVNVSYLQAFVDSKKLNEKKPIDIQALYTAGIIKKLSLPVKLLGNGKLSVALQISICSASASAIKIVEKAGGKVTITKKEAKAA